MVEGAITEAKAGVCRAFSVDRSTLHRSLQRREAEKQPVSQFWGVR